MRNPRHPKTSPLLPFAMLVAGFLVGRGAAWALDMGRPPAVVEATTTVGLTPVPDEGEGTRHDAEEDDPPAAVARAVPEAAEGVEAADEDENDVDSAMADDAHAIPAPAPVAPPVRRNTAFRIGTELKVALDGLRKDGENTRAPRGGAVAQTTIDWNLQQAAENMLRDYRVPGGAVVMMDPRNGQILAAAGYAEDGSFGRELAVVPLAPAASVFKIITGSALLEKGVRPDHETCYSGGKRRVREKDLKRVAEGQGGNCATFSDAMARSANIPFAHMTQRFLSQGDLQKWSGAFLFNSALPLGIPASPANIPSSGLDLYQAGAGFGDVRMSALHGALIAATVANDGVMPEPVLWKDQQRGAQRRILSTAHANELGAMMEKTVSEGTARRAFRERRRNALGDIRTAGKTGSLAEQGPFRDYSWFVGYAPADKPTVVVSTFIMNNAQWRIRASYVGREMLRTALVKGHKPYRPVEQVAHGG